MKHEPAPPAKRRVNLLLDGDTVNEARELGLNLSQIASRCLAVAVKAEGEARWEQEHERRIDAFATWLDQNGMPFEDLRLF